MTEAKKEYKDPTEALRTMYIAISLVLTLTGGSTAFFLFIDDFEDHKRESTRKIGELSESLEKAMRTIDDLHANELVRAYDMSLSACSKRLNHEIQGRQ